MIAYLRTPKEVIDELEMKYDNHDNHDRQDTKDVNDANSEFLKLNYEEYVDLYLSDNMDAYEIQNEISDTDGELDLTKTIAMIDVLQSRLESINDDIDKIYGLKQDLKLDIADKVIKQHKN